MPEDKRECTEVLNEIISKYSKVAFEKNSKEEVEKTESIQEQKLATEGEFWTWFCGEMKDKNFRKCFEDTKRDDFYGSLATIRKEYESRCK